MKNFIKGFIVGIGKIIPGVSGAIIAISMGIYDKSIEYICNFKNNIKESIKYLFPIGIGIILSIICFSKIISFCLDKFYLITMLFFVGLIIGGVPTVVRKIYKRDFFIVIVSFVFFFLISIGNSANVYVVTNTFFDYVMFFLSGIIEAIGTVVPGISSTALLMIVGTYNDVINAIGNLDNFRILIPFVIGLLFGLIMIVKIVYVLLSKCENKVYAFSLGVLLSSIILLIIRTFKYSVSFIYLVIGIIFMIIGIFIGNVMDEKK